MSEDGGDEALVRMISKLRAFGASAVEDAAKEAAPLVLDAVKATAAAGTTPDGEAWRARKDGSRAMPDAAASLTVTTKGERVIVKTTRGHAINNNLSEARRRQILPKRDAVPEAVNEALAEGARRAFEKAMRDG